MYLIIENSFHYKVSLIFFFLDDTFGCNFYKNWEIVENSMTRLQYKKFLRLSNR